MKRLIRTSTFGTLVVACLALVGCEKSKENPDSVVPVLTSSMLEQAAQRIQIQLDIQHNYLNEGCPGAEQSCYRAQFSIELPTEMPNNWRIVFSHLAPISYAQSEQFDLRHSNGDMHIITPKVKTLEANTPYEITFYGTTPLISESVLFPNYLLVSQDGEAHIIDSTREVLLDGHQVPRPRHVLPFETPQQLLRNANDKVDIANAGERFSRFTSRDVINNTGAPANTVTTRIIPKLQQSEWSDARVTLSNGVNIDNIKEHLANTSSIEQRFNQNGLAINTNGLPINVSQSTLVPLEGYRLNISDDGIALTYSDMAGLQYALMSVAQLFDASSNSLPVGEAEDSPYMAFRGLHIDVSRNFRSKDFIFQTLDQMAYYKLNKLHLHLADDEGWRLQVASLPELTQVGAFRCYDESERSCLLPQLAGGDGNDPTTQVNSGFYSIEDYIDILQYADARHIEVIPSLDMPGHSRAAIVSMKARHDRLMQEGKSDLAKQYFLTEVEDTSEYRSIQHYNDNTLNPCLPATYRFVEEVLVQLNTLHQNAGVPLKRYHIGADETAGAWANSPACNAYMKNNVLLREAKALGPYFIEQVSQLVSNMGIIPAAWSDGLSYADADNLPSKVQSNAWQTLYSNGHNQIHGMVNLGWDVVLSVPDVLYFDFPYEADPVEPGYFWGSRYTDSYQVFQFMPNNLPVHAEIWRDNFGHNYTANAETDLENGKRVLGIQAQLWSETVRSDHQANYMLYPRLLAVAERAWHAPYWSEDYEIGRSYSPETNFFDASQQQAMNTDWQSFAEVLSTKAMTQLVKDGIEPRVPLPGAVLKEGKLHMHSALDGLNLEFRFNAQDWQTYTSPVIAEETTRVDVRASVPETQISSRVQTLALP